MQNLKSLLENIEIKYFKEVHKISMGKEMFKSKFYRKKYNINY